jgi:hypothetical protein
MPRAIASATRKKKAESVSMPLGRVNFIILGVGLLVIVAGYVALSQEPWDGFLPLVVAPLLLVAGYCVLIPLGILYRQKNVAAQPPTQEPARAEPQTSI